MKNEIQKGIGIFGKQYEIMYKNDIHAKGSVDRVLTEQMVKLDDSSAGYLYTAYTDLSNRYKSWSRIILENITNGLKGQTDADTVDDDLLWLITAYVPSCDLWESDNKTRKDAVK